MARITQKFSILLLAVAAVFVVAIDGNAVATALRQPTAVVPSSSLTTPQPTGSYSSQPTGTGTGANGNLTSTQPTTNTTSNWAGYTATGTNITQVSGSWTVPSVSGTGTLSADATWIGIGGVSSNDLIQAGTQDMVSPNGTVSTTAFYELLPDASQPIDALTVNPGDTMSAFISETGADQWEIELKDLTTGQAFTQALAYESSNSSAEWIEEDPSGATGQLPLDSFGTISFTGGAATINGQSLSLPAAKAQEVTMNNANGQPLAVVSELASDGSFQVTRTSASSDDSITAPSGYGAYTGYGGGGWRRGTPLGRFERSGM